MNSKQSSDYRRLLPTAVLTLLGMALVFIASNNFGLPVAALAFGLALISFLLAAYYGWIPKTTNANLRRMRVQIFIIFGVASLLFALMAVLIPLPDRIEVPIGVGVIFGLLMFGFALSLIKKRAI